MNAPRKLPFDRPNNPVGVKVDPTGTAYVADAGNNRVVKLPPRT